MLRLASARVRQHCALATTLSTPRSHSRPNLNHQNRPSSLHLSTASSSASRGKADDEQQVRMLILGSPGAGKGTQSARLVNHFPIKVVVAGDVLRDHVGRGTEVGLRAKSVMQSGGLMPDEIMMELMSSQILELGNTNFLLDGFPRTLGQAQGLDKALVDAGRPLTLVANLDVPEEVILGRVLDRWVHLPSGRTYNLSYNPPKVAGQDDETGEPLSKRPDDNIETFTARLKSYHAQTAPLCEYFRSRSSSRKAEGGGMGLEYVNLQGRTSDEIWPKLEEVVRGRYPWLG
ncbi:unnamed protein product [Tilletia controversa]|uniref:Adenylate kinase active site lid domain-containing protein n=1 Tax=Tilletia controversa TaxID=13291 RepID=A0A8X7STM3_9BASI|nr:hypothetical protein CF328_g7205 [Tilletia controversa]KAE8240326.1 hypothetical protein A4X06_0g7816 [Tilletia controversa]CAD6905057.1 unnamed protein product [Tilletia controversa]CAD6967143.1 unnamed protein product [Tilletia controversa]